MTTFAELGRFDYCLMTPERRANCWSCRILSAISRLDPDDPDWEKMDHLAEVSTAPAHSRTANAAAPASTVARIAELPPQSAAYNPEEL